MRFIDHCTNEELVIECRNRGIPDATAYMADADAARAERDALKAQLDVIVLAGVVIISPCADSHSWNDCLNAPVQVCLKCGDRRATP